MSRVYYYPGDMYECTPCPENKLGGGNFGIVYLGNHIETQAKVAVKVLTNFKGLHTEMRELRITEGLIHSHIVRTYCNDFRDFETHHGIPPLIVMELCKGSLQDLMRLKQDLDKGFTWTLVRTSALQIGSALEYLGTRGITHRDLKPDNILLRKGPNFHLVLGDFGTAKNLIQSYLGTTFVGSPLYMAPEMLALADDECKKTAQQYYKNVSEEKCTQAVDYWSLGIILFQLTNKPIKTGIVPWYATDPPTYLERMCKTPFNSTKLDASVPDGLNDLICRLLQMDPNKRLGVKGVAQESFMEHPFLKGEAALWVDNDMAENVVFEIEDDSEIQVVSHEKMNYVVAMHSPINEAELDFENKSFLEGLLSISEEDQWQIESLPTLTSMAFKWNGSQVSAYLLGQVGEVAVEKVPDSMKHKSVSNVARMTICLLESLFYIQEYQVSLSDQVEWTDFMVDAHNRLVMANLTRLIPLKSDDSEDSQMLSTVYETTRKILNHLFDLKDMKSSPESNFVQALTEIYKSLSNMDASEGFLLSQILATLDTKMIASCPDLIEMLENLLNSATSIVNFEGITSCNDSIFENQSATKLFETASDCLGSKWCSSIFFCHLDEEGLVRWYKTSRNQCDVDILPQLFVVPVPSKEAIESLSLSDIDRREALSLCNFTSVQCRIIGTLFETLNKPTFKQTFCNISIAMPEELNQNLDCLQQCFKLQNCVVSSLPSLMDQIPTVVKTLIGLVLDSEESVDEPLEPLEPLELPTPDMNDVEIENLKVEIEAFETELNQVTLKVHHSTRENGILKEKTESLEESLEDVETEIKKLNAEMMGLQSSYDDILTEIETQEKEAEDILLANQGSRRRDLNKFNKKLTAVSKFIASNCEIVLDESLYKLE